MNFQWVGPAIGVLIVAVIVWAVWMARKRQRSLQEVAARLGMSYRRSDESLSQSGVTRLPMFSKGQLRANNVLEGDVRGATCYVFDYVYVSRKRHGKRSSYMRGTYSCFKLHDRRLPALQIRPASRGSGQDPIALGNFGEFAEHYTVTGEDEGAIRRVLTGELLDYMGRREADAWVVEADGEWIGIAKRPAVALARHVKPAEMQQFRSDVLQIFERLVT